MADPEGPRPTPEPLAPDFASILGEMAGYSQETNSPTRWNVRVFIAEIGESADYVANRPDASWEGVIASVERSLRHWKAYYCGVYPE
jgi:hypothetical protein